MRSLHSGDAAAARREGGAGLTDARPKPRADHYPLRRRSVDHPAAQSALPKLIDIRQLSPPAIPGLLPGSSIPPVALYPRSIQLATEQLDNVPLIGPWPCNALAESLNPFPGRAWLARKILNPFPGRARLAAENLNTVPNTARLTAQSRRALITVPVR